ncbi:MAG: NAD(P)-dependent glycerol-3-phosphate dehydrogenase [Proteobacteria bacterium]|nr:NAD(P)-dependent glycerol-3-phosphate dehydrogenase [Pseudomonadota bacterium]NDC23855.1 NAD(P)-dependent glycerol-3-phosphate dehydrogenase [Pseudomonadota bacterium]NDD03950.1 NAD(P)-dependent glycerol-3-phosphate dehydrogenase [Pseudomonadota bacterium]
MKNVCVVGQGAWGTAVANVFAEAGQSTTLWGRDSQVSQAIRQNHENPKYLKGVALCPQLNASTDLPTCLKKADLIVNAIPTQEIRKVFAPESALLKNKILMNTAKGIEIGTDLRVSEIFSQIEPTLVYSILSGPSFALETIQRNPTAVTLACLRTDTAEKIQELMSVPYFRIYTSQDVTGVELAGALKNIVAIASGVVSGLGLGYNTQAALINRGLAEILRLGKLLRAEPLTFFGLAGLGDLILTCTGPLSRNRNFGILLGKGKTVKEALTELGGVAEGFYTARSAYSLAKKNHIEMPILEQVYRMLYDGKSAQAALKDLMSRELKEEW